MSFAWRWVSKFPKLRWADNPKALTRFEYDHAMQPASAETATALPVYAYIDSWTKVHCDFMCVCGTKLAFHREGVSKESVIEYHQNCHVCKRAWHLKVEATLPTFDMTLRTRPT